jgi:hypothetical protein
MFYSLLPLFYMMSFAYGDTCSVVYHSVDKTKPPVICSSTLVGKNEFMTTASCRLNPLDTEKVEVICKTGEVFSTSLSVIERDVDPEFISTDVGKNDVALLKVNTSIAYSYDQKFPHSQEDVLAALKTKSRHCRLAVAAEPPFIEIENWRIEKGLLVVSPKNEQHTAESWRGGAFQCVVNYNQWVTLGNIVVTNNINKTVGIEPIVHSLAWIRNDLNHSSIDFDPLPIHRYLNDELNSTCLVANQCPQELQSFLFRMGQISMWEAVKPPRDQLEALNERKDEYKHKSNLLDYSLAVNGASSEDVSIHFLVDDAEQLIADYTSWIDTCMAPIAAKQKAIQLARAEAEAVSTPSQDPFALANKKLVCGSEFLLNDIFGTAKLEHGRIEFCRWLKEQNVDPEKEKTSLEDFLNKTPDLATVFRKQKLRFAEQIFKVHKDNASFDNGTKIEKVSLTSHGTYCAKNANVLVDLDQDESDTDEVAIKAFSGASVVVLGEALVSTQTSTDFSGEVYVLSDHPRIVQSAIIPDPKKCK